MLKHGSLQQGCCRRRHNRGAAYYRPGKEKEAMKDFREAARSGNREEQKILKTRGVSWQKGTT